MEIYLVRHAQEDIFQDEVDKGITKTGLRQSFAVANFLQRKGIKVLLASDLPRAYETAAVIGGVLGLAVKRSRIFREIQTPKGAWSEYARNRHPDFDFHPGGGESVREIIGRSRQAWEEILKASKKQDTVVICHSIFIKGLLYNLGYQDYLLRNDEIANTGVIVLDFEGDRVKLIKFNYYKHLNRLFFQRLVDTLAGAKFYGLRTFKDWWSK